jgi:hypothetical protein
MDNGWEIGIVEITWSNGRRFRILAYVNSNTHFAVHPEVIGFNDCFPIWSATKWAMTHKATGIKFPIVVNSHEQAQRAVYALESMEDWSSVVGPTSCDEWGKSRLRAICDAVYRIASTDNSFSPNSGNSVFGKE